MNMKEATRRRKNFLPTTILALLFWLGWGFLIWKIPPDLRVAPFFFYFFLFSALFLTLALLLANSRRSFLISLGIIGILFLNQLEQARVLNLILLFFLLVGLEAYGRRKDLLK